jgi:hypothetical protein
MVDDRKGESKMFPSSWYHVEMHTQREERIRKAAARHRDVGSPRRRIRRPRPAA